MEKLKQKSLEELRASRESVLSINKDSLSGQNIMQWFIQWGPAFRRAETISSPVIISRVRGCIRGYEDDRGKRGQATLFRVCVSSYSL